MVLSSRLFVSSAMFMFLECLMDDSWFDMSGKKLKQTKEDLINEPKIVALPEQTYSYGQTPAAICREHFNEIAKRLNVTVEELGRDVLNQSLGDQLCMLRDFYKSKNAESEAVYEPIVDLCCKEKGFPEKVIMQPKKRKTEKVTSIPKSSSSARIKKRVSRVLVLSSDESESEDKTKEAIVKPKRLLAKISNKSNPFTSRVEHSMEKTIPGSSDGASSYTHENLQLSEKQTQKNTEKIENIQDNHINNKPIEKEEGASNEFQPILTVCEKTKETIIEPASVVAETAENTINKEVEDDLETFLYGSPPKKKLPPPKKHKQFSFQPTNSVTNDQIPTSSLSVTRESPPPPEFSIPGLTFESNSWSPSRQRDLLSVARDIAVLQKSIASGEKPHDSVSDMISFTKPKN